MYRFSRSMYRELAPRVVEDDWDPTGCRHKQKVLDACEGAIRRLTYDRRYFARPARTLFNDVRPYFTMQDQLFVWRVIDCNMRLATEFLEQLPEGVGLDGRPAAVQRPYEEGHAVPAHPAAGPRLLPVPQAPRGDLRERGDSRAAPSETLDRELSSLAAA